VNPKISGFSLVRNGLRFDYPFLESWRSLLPLVDELVLNVGISDDETLATAQNFAVDEGQGKVKIIQSEWPLNDPEKKKSGLILSEQTNLALDACQYDWCIYLQADEVLHEADAAEIKEAIIQANADSEVEAIVFNYEHFYGSYDVVQRTRSAYRREIRAIKKSSGARSVGDAQSFRKQNDQKMKAILTSARVFHYGWVRTPDAMKEKTFFMDQLYHGESKQTAMPHTGDNYRYKRFWGLCQYQGSHPLVMKKRIQLKGWVWDLTKSDYVFKAADIKKVLLDGIEKITGCRLFEFKNYQLK